MIWTEAGHRRGMGDLMSSLAIARALRRRGAQLSVAVNAGAYLRGLSTSLRRQLTIVRSAAAPAELRRVIDAVHPNVLVLNRMDNPATLVNAALSEVRRVVAIDDRGPAAGRVRYRIYPLYPPPRFRGPRGSQFVPLGRRPGRLKAPVGGDCDRILVTQGGADTSGFTPVIVAALGALPAATRLDVVVGPAFRHEAALRRAVVRCGRPVKIYRNPRRLGALMREAKLAVTAGGLMMFELAYLGVPCVVVANEPFEAATADGLAAKGAVVSLGYGGDLSESTIRRAVERLQRQRGLRRRLSRNARAAVDGAGAERIADLILRWSAA